MFETFIFFLFEHPTFGFILFAAIIVAVILALEYTRDDPDPDTTGKYLEEHWISGLNGKIQVISLLASAGISLRVILRGALRGEALEAFLATLFFVFVVNLIVRAIFPAKLINGQENG